MIVMTGSQGTGSSAKPPSNCYRDNRYQDRDYRNGPRDRDGGRDREGYNRDGWDRDSRYPPRGDLRDPRYRNEGRGREPNRRGDFGPRGRDRENFGGPQNQGPPFEVSLIHKAAFFCYGVLFETYPIFSVDPLKLVLVSQFEVVLVATIIFKEDGVRRVMHALLIMEEMQWSWTTMNLSN